MRTIPTTPDLLKKSYYPAFPKYLKLIILLIITQFNISSVNAQCELPEGYIEVGSLVGSDVDELSEVIQLGYNKILVRGHLNIDFSWSLKGYSFIMDAGADMVTKGFIYFSLDQCTFRGCTSLWKGIVINSTTSFFMNNCTISDALNAIYVGPSGSGSNLSIHSNYFYNNSVGIRTSGILNGIFSVTYNKFYGTPNGLLNGNTALSGIFINHSAPGFYADGNLFDGIQSGLTCFADVYNLTLNNVYTNIVNDSGIDPDNELGSGVGSAVRILGGYNVKKPVVKVVGNPKAIYEVGPDHEFFKDNFSRCDRGVYIAGGAIGIVNNSDFIDCGYGVTIRNTGPGSYSKITLNSFSNPHVIGVDLRGNHNMFSSLIQYNKISINTTNNPDLIAAARVLATPSFEDQFVKIADNTISLSNGGTGIDLDGTAYTEVKGFNKILVQSGKAYKGINLHNKTNSCYITGTSFTGADKFYSFTHTKNKIGLYMVESENNIITCNYFNGVGISLNAIDNCQGTLFQHNEFAGGSDGLTMGSEAGLGALIDDQYATGNLWTGFYSHHDAVNYNPSCYGKFYIYPADKLPYLDNKYWPNKGAVPSQGDFLNSYDPAASTPSTDCGSGYSQSVKLTGIQLKIVKEDFKDLPATDYFKWSGKWMLFDKFKAVPELLNTPEVSDFMYVNRNSDQYAIWKVAADFQDAFSSGENSNDLLRASDNDKSNLYDHLSLLLPQWNANPKDLELDAKIKEIISTINDLEKRDNENLEIENGDFVKVLKSLKSNLSAINPTYTMDVNMATVLDIKIDMAMNPNADLTAETIKVLKSIATQCHLEGGDAVYVAKNILKSINIITEEDADICNRNQTTTSNNDLVKVSDTNVYPNPGSASLEVDLAATIETAQLSISDVLGNEKIAKEISGGHNVINTTDLTPGLYLVTIGFKDGGVKTIKWIKE